MQAYNECPSMGPRPHREGPTPRHHHSQECGTPPHTGAGGRNTQALYFRRRHDVRPRDQLLTAYSSGAAAFFMPLRFMPFIAFMALPFLMAFAFLMAIAFRIAIAFRMAIARIAFAIGWSSCDAQRTNGESQTGALVFHVKDT